MQLLRYVFNGVFATVVHYSILTFLYKVLGINSAAISNLIAASLGICSSFLGNRYFVFHSQNEPIFHQAMKFSGLYGGIAIIHMMILLIWTDFFYFDYRFGFLLATAVQFSLSYFGNKKLIFKY